MDGDRYLSRIKRARAAVLGSHHLECKTPSHHCEGVFSVGAAGFEPTTSCTPCKHASQAAPRPELDVSITQLRYKKRGILRQE